MEGQGTGSVNPGLEHPRIQQIRCSLLTPRRSVTSTMAIPCELNCRNHQPLMTLLWQGPYRKTNYYYGNLLFCNCRWVNIWMSIVQPGCSLFIKARVWDQKKKKGTENKYNIEELIKKRVEQANTGTIHKTVVNLPLKVCSRQLLREKPN